MNHGFTSHHCPSCKRAAGDDIIAPCDNKFCPIDGDHRHHWCPRCANLHGVTNERDPFTFSTAPTVRELADAAPLPGHGQLGFWS